MNIVTSIKTTIDKKHSHLIIYILSAVVGLLSGGVVVGYRLVIMAFENMRKTINPILASSVPKLMLWMCAAGVAGLITAFLIKKAPFAGGSGIPQVKAFLMHRLRHYSWQKELPAKFMGGTMAIGAGLSFGHEGPSVQLGSLIGIAVSNITKNYKYLRYLATAGAAAGLTSAFNAPLAGVLFCLEELNKTFSPVMLTSTLISAFVSNVVMWLAFGTQPIYSVAITQTIPLRYYFTSLLFIGIICGLLGALFNHGIPFFQKLYESLAPSRTLRFVSAFAIAAGITVFIPCLAGTGSELVNVQSQEGLPALILLAILAGKFVFTLFSSASGVPGGIFLPVLSMGAILGAFTQCIVPLLGIEGNFLPNYILLGMAGFFVAVFRAPITGAVLITEITGNFAHFPAFIYVSALASITAGLLRAEPVYDSLLRQFIPDNNPTVSSTKIDHLL